MPAHGHARKSDPSPGGKYVFGGIIIALGSFIVLGGLSILGGGSTLPSSQVFETGAGILAAGLALLGVGILVVRVGKRQSKRLDACARIAHGMKEGTIQQLAVALDTQLHLGQDKLLKSYIPLLQSYNNAITISGDRWTWNPSAEKNL